MIARVYQFDDRLGTAHWTVKLIHETEVNEPREVVRLKDEFDGDFVTLEHEEESDSDDDGS